MNPRSGPAVHGVERRIPHTDQANGDVLQAVVGEVVTVDAKNTNSLLDHPITSDNSPNDDMEQALKDMFDAAKNDEATAMRGAAQTLMDILMGTTQGKIYDGFAMLNFNRGAFVPDQVPGEYKMKVLRDTGLTEAGIRGGQVKIWEVDVNMLYYDGQIDSDTFLVKVPVQAAEFDTVRINYRVYSTVREDFSPTVVMLDRRLPGSVQFPFKGFDSVWIPFSNSEVVEFTMSMPHCVSSAASIPGVGVCTHPASSSCSRSLRPSTPTPAWWNSIPRGRAMRIATVPS